MAFGRYEKIIRAANFRDAHFAGFPECEAKVGPKPESCPKPMPNPKPKSPPKPMPEPQPKTMAKAVLSLKKNLAFA